MRQFYTRYPVTILCTCRLIFLPDDMQDDVVERSGPRRGERFRNTTRRHSAFALDDVNSRRILAIKIARSPRQAA